MPHILEILDLSDTSQLQVSVVNESGERMTAPPVAFALPLSGEELGEITWLLTGFPVDPFGDSQSRAETVETGLRGLGRLLFESVLRTEAPDSDSLTRIASGVGQDFQISVISPRPEFLSLPWELLNNPDSGYIAARAESVARLPAPFDALPEFSCETLSDSRLNVLMLCLAAKALPQKRSQPWSRWTLRCPSTA